MPNPFYLYEFKLGIHNFNEGISYEYNFTNKNSKIL
jgi:hypothetical protein